MWASALALIDVRVRDGEPPSRSAVAVMRSLSANILKFNAIAVLARSKCTVCVAAAINVYPGKAIVGIGVRVRVAVGELATTVVVSIIFVVVDALRLYKPTW